MAKQRCAACDCLFEPRRNVPQQRYCSKRACQRTRRRRWQRQKLKADADYRANQAAAQQRWRERHADYWRRYRQIHPEYAERNREQQRERNRRRRSAGTGPSPPPIAKMGTDQTCFTHPGLDRRTDQLAIYTRLVTPLRGVTHLSALCATSRDAMRQRNRLHREAVRPGAPAILLPVDRFSGWYCAFGRHDNRDLRPGIINSEIGENAIAA